MLVILLVVVLIFSLGGLPNWGWHSLGYGPSSIGAIILVILVVLLLTGRL
jgi:hypothetical protein